MSDIKPAAKTSLTNSQQQWIKIVLILSILEGFIALHLTLAIRSESENALFLGYSAPRLIMVIGIICGLFILTLMLNHLLRNLPKFTYYFTGQLRTLLASLVCWVGFWIIFALFWISLTGSQASDATISSLVFRVWQALLWFLLLLFQFSLLYATIHAELSVDSKGRFFSVLFALFVIIFWLAMRYYDRIVWDIQMRNLEWILAVPVLIALVWGWGKPKIKSWTEQTDILFICLLIGAITFAVYRCTGFLAGRFDTPSKAYWDVLADAFNHGRLHVINPATTHDMTFFDGRWYVPNPPFPAILLMPIVALFGVENVNMTIVSALIGAVDVILIFLTLHYASKTGMTNCSKKTNLWVTTAFALSTNHYWLATTGQMWFVSHLVTTGCMAFGTIAVIRNWRAWTAGAFFGMALMARPNIFPIAIFYFGIWLWKQHPFPKFNWRQSFRWVTEFTFPVLFAAFLILLYNKLRFDNWLDFGYVSITSSTWIMETVQQYGMFHPHFFKTNFETMFLRLPRIEWGGSAFFFQPGYAGFSMFAMTPVFFYAFRAFKKNWWQISTWVSIILTATLLLLYHNTGAEQVGYRYIMDAIVPLLLLVAAGVGDKISLVFKGLTGIGVLVNILCIYWWYIGRAL